MIYYNRLYCIIINYNEFHSSFNFFLKRFRYKAVYSKLNSCFWLDIHRTETRFDLA